MDDPEYLDTWYAEQCMHCRFFIPLSGALAEDWGVCSNPDSSFDGLVRFEQDGCRRFSQSSGWWPHGEIEAHRKVAESERQCHGT